VWEKTNHMREARTKKGPTFFPLSRPIAFFKGLFVQAGEIPVEVFGILRISRHRLCRGIFVWDLLPVQLGNALAQYSENPSTFALLILGHGIFLPLPGNLTPPIFSALR
jgi:hypothetical protein